MSTPHNARVCPGLLQGSAPPVFMLRGRAFALAKPRCEYLLKRVQGETHRTTRYALRVPAVVRLVDTILRCAPPQAGLPPSPVRLHGTLPQA